jgi:hypothetical protein
MTWWSFDLGVKGEGLGLYQEKSSILISFSRYQIFACSGSGRF